MIIFLAFLCGVLMDVIWSKCVSAVAHHRPAVAAHLSIGLYLCTIVSTVLIVDSQWLSIAAFIAGSWIGTYCTVRWWSR